MVLLLRIPLWLFLLFVLLRCNVYAPLRSASSDADYLEEATKCLHDNDAACAAEQYEKLSNADLKNEKLCTLYVSEAGLGLSAIPAIKEAGAKMLSAIAGKLLPWSQVKSDASDKAVTYCTNLAASPSAGDLSTLLKFISILTHCSTRIAKTDQFVASSNSDTACTTAGNGDGKITQSDIGDGALGTITSKGMCSADVRTCITDLASMSTGDLEKAGYTDLKDALNKIPAALKQQGADAIAGRKELRDNTNAD